MTPSPLRNRRWLCSAALLVHPLAAATAQAPSTDLAAGEGLRGVESRHEWLRTDPGYRVRAIVTRPTGVTRRLPAILFVQWLSCDPVSLRPQGGGGWTQMLRGMIERSQAVFWRTEKPGLDGSEGPPCAELDYQTDLSVHRAALQTLRARPDVDPDSVFIFGASMGGTMAPLLAAETHVRGVMVWGTTGFSWLQHLVALDRRVLELRATTAGEVTRRMADHQRLLEAYLVSGHSPPEILRAQPDLRGTWEEMVGTGPDHQYGRPFRFHQQAHQAGWEAAWPRVRSPVLVVHGEHDWIMGAEEHQRIVELANRGRPGIARLATIPRMDHHFETYPNPERAFAGEGGTFDPAVLEAFLDWLAEQRGRR